MQVLLNQVMQLYVKLLLILNGLIYLTVRWCYLVQPQKQDHYLASKMESKYCCRRFTKLTSLGKILNTIQQGNATLIAPMLKN
jgi:hypothetical protein